ncbi:MAG: hypothetical protein LUD15_01305 [Bacteroides sp.]|nr:hypothetical protein [Bacteroides sp.]
MVHYKSINRATHSLSEREDCFRHTKFQEDTPGIFLKTCNRIEFYYGEEEVPEELIRHLFQVTSGLESSLIGERAVQGQVKEAYRLAAGRFKLSPSLHQLFQSALATGKRVRTETAISQGAVSHSLAVIELLSRQPLCLSNAIITVIGVNKLTRDTLLFLRNKGAFTLFLANRSVEKARLLADSVGCEVRSLREKRELLALSDVVISATSAPHTLICPKDLVPGQKQIIFDLAFPQDVEEAVRDIPGVTLFNLEDIEIQMDRNRAGRAAEIVGAEVIIEEEIDKFKESLIRRKVYQQIKKD